VDNYRERQRLAVRRIVREREQALKNGTAEPVTDWREADQITQALAQESYRMAGWYEGIDDVTSQTKRGLTALR
jgi:hypothetical protein